MNKLFLYLFILSYAGIAYADWFNQAFSEDDQNQYWVGMSNPQVNEKVALDEAYNEAIKEAIKYNFGFNQKLVESFYQTLNKTESQQESSVSMNNILVKKVKPTLQLVKEKDGKYIAYKKIAYPKVEIQQEISRLKSIDQTVVINDTLVAEDQSQILSNIYIKTEPSLAKITLTNKDTKKTYFSTSNAKMIIPTGAYQLDISKPGFDSISHDYIVGLSNKDSSFSLKKQEIQVLINIAPEDATVKINGKVYQNKTWVTLGSGTFQVSLSHANYLSTSFDHIVSSSTTSEIRHVLKPKNSALYIQTEPEDARVYVNGTYLGQSPITGVEFPAEQIEISIVKKGFDLRNDVVSINPNKNNLFNFKLSRKQ